jgi:tRNA-guanine family transglycosylase
VGLGADMFDCVWPTRTARFGNAITRHGVLNLKHSRYSEDFGPVEEGCKCTTCRPKNENDGLAVSRAYIHHLAAKETVGAHLLTMHNVHWMLDLMKRARTAILEDQYPAFARQFFVDYFGDKGAPEWAVNALKEVNIGI